MNVEWLISAFILGLLGSGHCIGMCGGIGAALNVAISPKHVGKRVRIIFAYNAGRLFSYALIGALAAMLGLFAPPQFLRIAAAVILFLMALYLADISRLLKYVEKAGGLLWKHVQPVAQRLLPVHNEAQAALLGALWGWLPCGLVYSALVLALAQGSALGGALYMLAFGLGTLPAVLAGALAANSITRYFQRRGFRLVMAACMLVFSLWTLWGAFAHSSHEGHAGHAQQHSSQSELTPDSHQHHEHHH